MSKILKDKIDYALNNQCTKQEATILNYLLSNLENIDTLTATEVARMCYCSTSAVNRAVKKIGLAGYLEFKNYEKFNEVIEKKQSGSTTRYSKFINGILDEINYNDVEVFASNLSKYDMLYVYGNGVSNISSLFLFRQLLNLSYNVIYIPDMDLLHKIKHGAIIIVSNTGANDNVNEIISESKQPIFAITKYNSNLDNLSINSITHNIDYSLATEIEREQQIQMLLLIGALIDNLS